METRRSKITIIIIIITTVREGGREEEGGGQLLLTEETAHEYDGVQSDENHFHVGPVKDVVLVQRHVVKDAFVAE